MPALAFQGLAGTAAANTVGAAQAAVGAGIPEGGQTIGAGMLGGVVGDGVAPAAPAEKPTKVISLQNMVSVVSVSGLRALS